MPFRVYSVPVLASEEQVAPLNQFLASHRVVLVDRRLVEVAGQAVWSFCVEYVTGNGSTPSAESDRRGRVDYKERLEPAAFAVYVKLRELRKKLSESEGVPAYTIFTNEQLAQMVQRQVTSVAQMREIDGVGESRCQKYGQAMLNVLSEAQQETVPCDASAT